MVLNRHCIRHRSPALKEALATRRNDSLKASAPESPSSAHRGFHGASNKLLAARPLVVGTAISLCSWGLEILAVYLCVVAIGAEVRFLVVTFIFAVASLGGALTMLPGGIGAVEAGMTGMFVSLANLSGGLSVALTFVLRLATVWFATLIGVLGLLFVRRWQDARPAPYEKGTGR